MHRSTLYKGGSGDVPILDFGYPLELRSGDSDQNMRNIKELCKNSGRKDTLPPTGMHI